MNDDDQLTDVEVQTTATVLGEALSRTQQNRDEFVRVIAAGAVAVTASLIAALKEAGWSGGLAIGLASASLAAVLASFWSAESGIRQRRRAAWRGDRKSVETEPWFLTRVTNALNAIAGLCLVGASAALVVFVITHSD
jgi:hypothetical protein